MRTVTLPDGTNCPVFGLGTWRMGEQARIRTDEVASLRHGLDRGVRLIDTAEMYGEGEAEAITGEAIAGRRHDVFLVSKVYPHNASRAGVVAACERSLKRLGTDRLDLYLLHWRGSYPLAETIDGFETLKRAGKIKAWGVSNFDTADLSELARVTGGDACASNQVLYHLGARGVEWDLLASCQAKSQMVMAYSPLGQGPLLKSPILGEIGRKHGVEPAAIALAFLLTKPNVVVIPKSTQIAHLDANLKALNVSLDATDLAAIDRAFPPPRKKSALGML